MISREIFLENAVKAWRFSVDVAWDQHRRHPELSRGRCLRERSFLRTLLGDDRAPVFLRACRLADSAASKEEMHVLLPEVLEWMAGRYPPAAAHPGFAPGGSFRYEPNGRLCYLHIRNAKQPESFLDDPAYVVNDLRRIMERAERDDGCDTFYTASWLNSLPAFLRFFPPEWRDNLAEPPDGAFGATLGWQGQFINRAGLLNEATAAEFLRTGVLPYARLESRCSFAAARRYWKAPGF